MHCPKSKWYVHDRRDFDRGNKKTSCLDVGKFLARRLLFFRHFISKRTMARSRVSESCSCKRIETESPADREGIKLKVTKEKGAVAEKGGFVSGVSGGSSYHSWRTECFSKSVPLFFTILYRFLFRCSFVPFFSSGWRLIFSKFISLNSFSPPFPNAAVLNKFMLGYCNKRIFYVSVNVKLVLLRAVWTKIKVIIQ